MLRKLAIAIANKALLIATKVQFDSIEELLTIIKAQIILAKISSLVKTKSTIAKAKELFLAIIKASFNSLLKINKTLLSS